MPPHHVHARSVRRSRHRRAVLLALADLGEAYLGQLAAAAGLRSGRARAALVGDDDYRGDLALVATGLVAMRETPFGRVYALTPAGRALVAEMRGTSASAAALLAVS